MANLVNDTFNLLPWQCSSNNTSRYFYSSGMRGTQTGTTFHDANATFTSAMKGGLLQYAANVDGADYSFSSVILEVVNSTTLTMSISQNFADTEYKIWYGGVQFDQTGIFAAEGLILAGASFTPGNFAVENSLLTSLVGATYTPPTTAKYLTIEGVAGGGAGGSAQNQIIAVGAAGGAGAYFKITVPSQAFTYQCGAAGAPAAGTTGGSGGSTVITGLTAGTITALGGVGGAAAFNTIAETFAQGGNGGGATVLTNLLSVAGQPGGYSFANTAAGNEALFLNAGGSTPFGAGGKAAVSFGVNATATGGAATGYGSGGAGSGRIGSGAITSGGAGAQGAIYVTAYSL